VSEALGVALFLFNIQRLAACGVSNGGKLSHYDSTYPYDTFHERQETTTSNKIIRTTNHSYTWILDMRIASSHHQHSVDSTPLPTILLLIIVARFVSASPSHAASRWKAPNPSTPLDQTRRWQVEDDELHKYIASSVPAVLDHTGSDAFDEHLRGVQAILRYWGSPQHLTNAGLFHSICEPKFTP
jgi:hypothetical protein